MEQMKLSFIILSRMIAERLVIDFRIEVRDELGLSFRCRFFQFIKPAFPILEIINDFFFVHYGYSIKIHPGFLLVKQIFTVWFNHIFSIDTL